MDPMGRGLRNSFQPQSQAFAPETLWGSVLLVEGGLESIFQEIFGWLTQPSRLTGLNFWGLHIFLGKIKFKLLFHGPKWLSKVTFLLFQVIFYGFDPMGFITMRNHHLGNMFVIFSNHRTSTSRILGVLPWVRGSMRYNYVVHVVQIYPSLGKVQEHMVINMFQMGLKPFSRWWRSYINYIFYLVRTHVVCGSWALIPSVLSFVVFAGHCFRGPTWTERIHPCAGMIWSLVNLKSQEGGVLAVLNLLGRIRSDLKTNTVIVIRQGNGRNIYFDSRDKEDSPYKYWNKASTALKTAARASSPPPRSRHVRRIAEMVSESGRDQPTHNNKPKAGFRYVWFSSLFEQWSRAPGWLGYIGDGMPPSYIGIIIIQ